MPARRALPPFIPPMLARAGSVFDSRDHLYEIKWDGTRAQVLVDGDGYRLLNRRRSDLRERYPELELLRRLPRGTILDGEIVVLRDGRPDFGLLLSREHARERLRIAGAARAYPATYVVFDQLYSGFVSRLSDPLEARRARLEETLARYASSRETVAFSEGIREHGCAYFAEACRRGLEGVIAKRLGSRYEAGRRSGAWVKIKARTTIHCAIIGFVPAPSGAKDFRSLIIAAEEDGVLRSVGRVGSGIDERTRRELNARLWKRLRERPVVPARGRGLWVEPGLFCAVSYSERTARGELRAPVFEGLVEG